MASAIFRSRARCPTAGPRDVLLTVEGGAIAAVEPGRRRPAAPTAARGIALPGLPNLHSHAFQRGMAGLAERRGPAPTTASGPGAR